jgi:acetyl esterase
LTGLPPAIVVTATLDPLHDEGVEYARRLRSQGVSVIHRDFRGLFHGFLTMLEFPPAVAGRDVLWSDMRALLTVPVAEAVR